MDHSCTNIKQMHYPSLPNDFEMLTICLGKCLVCSKLLAGKSKAASTPGLEQNTQEKERKEKTTSIGDSLMRSQVLWAAQAVHLTQGTASLPFVVKGPLMLKALCCQRPFVVKSPFLSKALCCQRPFNQRPFVVKGDSKVAKAVTCAYGLVSGKWGCRGRPPLCHPLIRHWIHPCTSSHAFSPMLSILSSSDAFSPVLSILSSQSLVCRGVP